METPVTGRPTIEVFREAASVGEGGAELFLSGARRAILESGRFTVALSGGSSPIPLFRRLAESAPVSGIDWGKAHVFWVDERCVPPDHPDSNFRLAHEFLLSRIPAPGPVVHRIAGELPPEEAARACEADLARSFPGSGLPRFDMVWLGLGSDGHTASLFPGSDLLGFAGRTAVPVTVTGPKHPRVTLTLPVINNARHVVFLVTGSAKAGIVAEILAGSGRERYPAAQVAPRDGILTWLLDAEAAGGLDRSTEHGELS
jgi:6-phosphogluconolactonase